MDAQTAATKDLKSAINRLAQGDINTAAASCDAVANFLSEQIQHFESPGGIADLLERCLNDCCSQMLVLGSVSPALKTRIRDHVAFGFLFLGRARQQLRQWSKAMECFQKGLELAPLPDDDVATTFYNMADCCEEIGDLNRAVNLLDKALCVKPDDSDALFNLAMFNGRLGRFSEAAKVFERYLQLNPGDEEVQKALADTRNFESRGEQDSQH